MHTEADLQTLLTLTEGQVVEVLEGPLDDYAHQCHAASIWIVKSDLFHQARVARGSCQGVMGQHSWVVVGDDCYDPEALILDVTAWSYDDRRPRIWKTTASSGLHRPHGAGLIYDYGMPQSSGGDPIALPEEVASTLTPAAFGWLGLIGPLDARGWMALANAPVDGWPSDQIIAAMYRTPGLRALVPIDRVGMLTDFNPGGLYLKGDEVPV